MKGNVKTGRFQITRAINRKMDGSNSSIKEKTSSYYHRRIKIQFTAQNIQNLIHYTNRTNQRKTFFSRWGTHGCNADCNPGGWDHSRGCRYLLRRQLRRAPRGSPLPLSSLNSSSAYCWLPFLIFSFPFVHQKSFQDLDDSDDTENGSYKFSASSREKRARRKADRAGKPRGWR